MVETEEEEEEKDEEREKEEEEEEEEVGAERTTSSKGHSQFSRGSGSFHFKLGRVSP